MANWTASDPNQRNLMLQKLKRVEQIQATFDNICPCMYTTPIAMTNESIQVWTLTVQGITAQQVNKLRNIYSTWRNKRGAGMVGGGWEGDGFLLYGKGDGLIV